jgi:hypothetical protein
MSFLKKHSSKLILLLAASLLISACNLIYNPMRYPNLHKIEKDLAGISPTKNVFPVLDLKTKDTSTVRLKFRMSETKYPLALFVSHNAGVKSVPLKKIMFKSLRLHHSLPAVKEMKRLFDSSKTPPYALVVFLIALMSICLGWGIIILLLSTTGQSGCLVPLFAIAALCGVLIIIFLN